MLAHLKTAYHLLLLIPPYLGSSSSVRMIAKTGLNNEVQQQIVAMIAAAYWSLQATFVRPPPHRDGAPRTLLPPPTPCSMGFALLLHGNHRLSSIALLHGIPPSSSAPVHCLAVVLAPSSGRSLWREARRAPTASRGFSTRSATEGLNHPVQACAGQGRGGLESWMSQRKHDRSLASLSGRFCHRFGLDPVGPFRRIFCANLIN